MRCEAAARTVALIRHNTLLMSREPGPVLSRFLMPLAAIAVFEPLYRAAAGGDRQAGAAQAVTGMLVLFSMLALSIVGTSIMAERSWRTWDRLRAGPVRPIEVLIGKAMPVLVVLTAQQVVVLASGVLVFDLRVADFGLLALAVAGWVICLLAIGVLLGATLASQAQLAAVQDIGGFALTSLGGALVPLTAMPPWAQHIAPVSPGYWAMAAFRGALTGEPVEVYGATGVLAAFTTVAVAVATWRLARGFDRSTKL